MDGFAQLEEAIRSMPVPGAPPRLSLDGAAVGLSFLDTALRLNHVRRLTERISLVDHQVARRITEVDVRLGMLDEGQRQASELFRSITSYSRDGAEHKESAEHTDGAESGRTFGAPEMWVPVARISRTAAPVDVRDASGRKLPRLTQYETSRLLASGLYRLLRGILTGFPDARCGPVGLLRSVNNARRAAWISHRGSWSWYRRRASGSSRPRSLTPGMAAGHAANCRDKALQLLADYREPLGDYFAAIAPSSGPTPVPATQPAPVAKGGADQAVIEALRQVDAGLTKNTERAVRRSKSVCEYGRSSTAAQ
ncbi:hypothetical protein AVR91_0211735 [Amycolatopsis keratiniphila subsp. keratiniphila]|uniref:Uncharacterized protein n=1 Tax=Amycolatopsis keratiniphila subsp. keratiniphila TaxID=227715 RepID=A0A1W2LWX4_9PSEU|nr:hypothetical protein AVR91_0211735 [Amycolatopsis keratiniphila subsp. keratiniphila]